MCVMIATGEYVGYMDGRREKGGCCLRCCETVLRPRGWLNLRSLAAGGADGRNSLCNII